MSKNPLAIKMTDKVNLLDYDRKSLESFFTEMGDKSFRAQQVLKWIYHQGTVGFNEMTNLSKSLRAKLEENTCIKAPKIKSEQKSADGTYKWLIEIDAVAVITP